MGERIEDRRDSIDSSDLQSLDDNDVRFSKQHEPESREDERGKGKALPKGSHRLGDTGK